MARTARILLFGMVLCAAGVQWSAPAAPAGACGGVAPATWTCTNPNIEATASVFASHGSLVVTPAYVGRLRSTLNWKEGTKTGARSYYCDYKNPEDYVNGANPVASPNCTGTGTWPPGISAGKCLDTAPDCDISWNQVCTATAYKSDAGKGSGPWECHTYVI